MGKFPETYFLVLNIKQTALNTLLGEKTEKPLTGIVFTLYTKMCDNNKIACKCRNESKDDIYLT
jgi:hypothetical protein